MERALHHAVYPAASSRALLLLVDDDPLITDSLQLILKHDYEVISAATRKQAHALLDTRDTLPKLALIDLGLPPVPHRPDEGFALVHDLLGMEPTMKVLVLSGQDDQTNIRRALTMGAVDFIPKPCETGLLKARLDHQLTILEAEQKAPASASAPEMIGNSDAMRSLRGEIRQLCNSPHTILIEGESGVGKEMVVCSLHELSDRSKLPYLSLNCGAFNPELLESTLFGHARGAFTGATEARCGFFEEAKQGTLFLDEIGELPESLQVKLLRVLDNGEYYRLGEVKPQQSKARIIAATNRDLRRDVNSGRFRADLYHRLSVLTISVPPLRVRGDDYALLLDHFNQLYSHNGSGFHLSDDANTRLKTYDFPGNIRELRNIVIRLSAKFPGQEVTADELERELDTNTKPQEIASSNDVTHSLLGNNFNLDVSLAEMERRYIDAALELSHGNLSQAARMLGINRTTLYSRVNKLGRGLS